MAFPGIYIDGGTTSSLLNYVIGSRNADNERYRINTSADLEREKIASSDQQHAATIEAQTLEIENRHKAAMAAVAASNKATESQEKVAYAKIAFEDKKAAREFSRIQRMTDSAEQQAAVLNSRQHIDRTGDTLQGMESSLRIEAQAHFKVPSEQLTDEKLKEYAIETDQYDAYKEAVRSHTNAVNAIVAGTEQINARASGFILRTVATDDPKIKGLLDAKGIKADGDNIGVYVEVGKDGEERIVDFVKTSQGLPAVSDNAFTEYRLSKIYSAGVGALSPEESKAMAETGVQLARQIAEDYKAGKITSEAANAALTEQLAVLDGNADAVRAQAQTIIDESAKGFVVTDEALYRKGVEEATKGGYVPIVPPKVLPASDLGLARNLNSLDRLAAGAGVAFNYSDRAGDAAREAAVERAAKRMEYGLALTGENGELANALTHRAISNSTDNPARFAHNELMIGNNIDKATDLKGKATGAAIAGVSRYIKDGKLTNEQKNAMRKLIIDNYDEWSTELGLPKDISKLTPEQMQLLQQKALIQQSSLARSKTDVAADVARGLGVRVKNAVGETLLVPGKVVAGLRQNLPAKDIWSNAVSGIGNTIPTANLPPIGAEAGEAIFDRKGNVIVPNVSGAATWGQGSLSDRAASRYYLWKDQNAQQYPNTFR